MATLRNLRNLLKANISEEHHVKVIRYLTSPRAVIGSKQFPFRCIPCFLKSTLSFPNFLSLQLDILDIPHRSPLLPLFRFFSAYQVLNQLKPKAAGEDSFGESPSPSIAARRGRAARGRGRGGRGGRGVLTRGRSAARRGRAGGRGRGRGGQQQTQRRPSPARVQVAPELVERYKRAVDRAVQLAAQHNLDPIAGSTYVFVDVSDNMSSQQPVQSARIPGFSKQVLRLRTFTMYCIRK